MTLRTPLARVRGLGSAKDGTHHWWMQRITAVALVPMSIWFVVSMIKLTGADHAAVSAWLATPVTAVLMLLFIIATFHHLQLGMQVVIEDYVHGEGTKIFCLMLNTFFSILVGLACIFAIIKLSLGT